MDTITSCGRYTKRPHEPFFRRRATHEPVETPRRYYESTSAYNDGKSASAAAWEIWKQEKYGNQRVSRAPWFELVDKDLRSINRLIQSPNEREFHTGLRRLFDRITTAYDANVKLHNQQKAGNPATTESNQRAEAWTTMIRRGPPLLSAIFRHLKSDSIRRDGQKALAQLCDDRLAAKVMRTSSSGGEGSRPRQPTADPKPQHIVPASIPKRPKIQVPQPAQLRPKPLGPQIVLPALASAKTMASMDGRGTEPPVYVPSEQFTDINNEHGVERPPAYSRKVEKVPPVAMFIPKNQLGEDAYAMQKEGRQNVLKGVGRTMVPNNVLRGD